MGVELADGPKFCIGVGLAECGLRMLFATLLGPGVAGLGVLLVVALSEGSNRSACLLR